MDKYLQIESLILQKLFDTKNLFELSLIQLMSNIEYDLFIMYYMWFNKIIMVLDNF